MMRQSSSRIQRSKGGFRLKYVLQICLLLAICTWLLYQVKHSHDKKRAFEERITKFTSKVSEKQQDLFNFGRKSLPFADENDPMRRESQSKDEENEEEVQEEGEQEHDTNHEESEDEEGKGDGDDRIDEHDQDGGGDENERDEEFTSEEEKDGQSEEEVLFDNQVHDDTSQEAREENYKRDDVSSAVSHDVNVTETEPANAGVRGSDENLVINDVKMDNSDKVTNGTVDEAKRNSNSTSGDISSLSDISVVPAGENLTVPTAHLPVNSNSSNTTAEFSKPENDSNTHPGLSDDSNQKEVHTNMTFSTLSASSTELTVVPVANASDSQMGIQNNSTMDGMEYSRGPSQNGTSNISVQDENIGLANGISGEQSMNDRNEKFNTNEAHVAEHNPRTSAISGDGAAAQGEHDALSNNSVMSEEHDAHIDQPTLPDISNEVKHVNDHATE
ncbi:hypothetical protein AXF42_Ash010385 [Apostasia shenzhenica]|uniref:Uncharacterized protein n=1 Tax=Apostasia shenzhenica TaxID=1088818 RepID=A0A2I0BDY0_9ASPA|nr:hypothetical protein AXF42_Ash010385 [Apostasia shenzhenica]